jgi:hypothetical protein
VQPQRFFWFSFAHPFTLIFFQNAPWRERESVQRSPTEVRKARKYSASRVRGNAQSLSRKSAFAASAALAFTRG